MYYLPGPVSATDLEIMRRPESQEVLRASNIGSPVTVSGATSAPGRAYLHAARRLCGEVLPMTIPTDRKGLLDKLFGRRAA